MKKPGPALAVALVVTLVVGCGDDDGGDTAAACDAYVAVDEELSINEDLQAGIAAIESFVAAAPEEVAAQVEPLVPLLQEDPEAALESEAAAVASQASDEYALDNCGDTRVDLEAVNFAFVDMPTEIDSGRVAFVLDNRTQTDEAHEALLLHKSDSADGPAHEVLAAALDGNPVSVETTIGALEQFGFVGAGLVEPEGDVNDVFVVDLEPGEYVIACLLPVDSAQNIEAYFAGEPVDGRYHFQEGMFAEFTVT